ncbi:MAG: beta-phosphoglucomutase [Culicoidibacterales bacterium]
MFKAAIFDLDGVITDTAEYHYNAWLKLAKSLNIVFTREFNEELKGVSRIDSLYKILEYGNKRNQYSEIEIEQLAAEKNTNYLKMLENLSPDDILPGIVEFLEELKNHNIQIGLASASKNAPYILEKLGIRDYFETIANPEMIVAGKPEPDIFLLAAANLGVNPEDCIGFEDAISGVQALKKANMRSVAIGEGENFRGLNPNLILNSTRELKFKEIDTL